MEPSSQPLVCPSHKTHYVLAFFAGALIAGAALYTYGFQKGFTEAKNRIVETPAGQIFRSTEDIRALSGVVTAIDANSITLKVYQINPFEDPGLAVRTVTVTQDAKITKRTPGDIQKFIADQEAFIKKMQASPKTTVLPPVPPEPTITTIMLSDIKEGDTVTVSATDNVATTKTFPVNEVQVQ